MNIWKKVKEHFYLSKRHKRIFAGTVCLVLAGILICSALSDGAVRAAGIRFEEEDLDFWNKGSNRLKIRNIDGFSVRQELAVKEARLRTDGREETVAVESTEEGKEGSLKTSIKVPYSEDGSFVIPDIQSKILIDWGTPKCELEILSGVWVQVSGDYTKQTLSPREAKTYYRVITEQEPDFDEEEFEDGVRAIKYQKFLDPRETITEHSLMSYGGRQIGRAFNQAVDAWLEGNGYEEYKPGTAVPLVTESGEAVVRIHMLTYYSADLEFQVQALGSYFNRDFDLTVYTSHSYEFSGPAEKMAAPGVLLESGMEVNEPLSPDDSIVDLVCRQEDQKEDFGKGIRQYFLSDEKTDEVPENAWTDWNGTSVPLEGRKYLYTRVIHDGEKKLSDYTRMGSEAECFALSYMGEADMPGILGKAKAGENGSDQIALSASDPQYEALPVIYSTAGNVEFTKVPYEERRSLGLDNEAPGEGAAGIIRGGTTYIRVNNLWFACGEETELYTEPLEVTEGQYGGSYFSVWASVVSDGSDIHKTAFTKIRAMKLEAPSAVFLSGSPAGTGLSRDDALSGLEPVFPENLEEADRASYEAAYGAVELQYCLSETALSGVPEELWQDFDPEADYMWLEGKPYLYTRAVYSDDTGGTLTFSGNKVREYYLNYINMAPAAGVRAEVDADPSISETYTDRLVLSADAGNGLIFYTLDGSEPSFIKVEDKDVLGTLSGDSGSCVEQGGTTYVRVNGLWYSCGENTRHYVGPVELTGADHVVKAKALADQRTLDGETAEFTFHKLNAPSVVLESGKSPEEPIPYDDTVISLANPYDPGKEAYEGFAGGRLQYYLSDRKMNTISDGFWLTWDGTSEVALNRKEYLYVRVLSGKDGYVDSAPREYRLQYITEAAKEVVAKAYAGGEEVSGGVDYGDAIELIELETSDKGALIFYTLDGSSLSFEKVPYSERSGLDSVYPDSAAQTILLDGKRYVKMNNLWYECGSSVQFYEKEISVDESIYVNNYLTVNAVALCDGCAVGISNRYSYSLTLRNQAAAPSATPESGSAVQMGDAVNLLCATSGSRIFYTLDGSAPIVDIRRSELVLGENTFEYTGTPIIISDEFVEYGGTATIMVQAGCFTEHNGILGRTMKDSPLTRITYHVGTQSVVESVTSVPATSSDDRTEVEAGTSIHLYTSTEDAVIFYTLDGTEPVFNETTLEAENESTFQYNSSQGIKVPEMAGSSLFTITAVAYREGLAASDISRLIFRYPAAVSSPYASPMDGAVTEGTQVTLRTAAEDAVIYYEIAYGDEVPDDPTELSSVFDASNPFSVTKKTTIKAFAVKSGMKSSIVTFVYTVSDKLSTPKPSIASGSVAAAGTVITLEADSGATIYYTTDGSDPKKADNKKVLVGESVILNGSAGTVVTVRTYASKSGYSDSETGYYSYSISEYDGGIFADKEDGSVVKNGDVIQLNTDVSDADIFYTVDGSTPDTGSSMGSRVTISGNPGENVIVKAVAIASGTDKAISAATFTYVIMDKLAAPSASVPDGAVFTEEGTVVLSAETGKIYYTTNGEEPTASSSLYKRAIVVDRAMTVKAVAVDGDYEQSSVSTFSYGFADQVAAPQANFASGELEMGTEVTFHCETEDAKIYYRTDGADPDPEDKDGLELYTGPILLERATNFKVIAVKEHMQDSRVVTVGYTVREPEAPVEVEEEESQVAVSTSGRLQSRHSFAGEESGPSFSAVVLRNAAYQTVVSAEEGVLPDNVQLKVEPTQVSDAASNMVKQVLSENYGIVESYNVTLLVNGEEVQPEGEIEIGLPIPADYENSIIHIVQHQEDGSVKVYSARRSGGTAYAKTDHLSVYSIAAPVEYEEKKADFPWLLVIYSMAAAFTGLGIWFLRRAGKKRKEDEDWDV